MNPGIRTTFHTITFTKGKLWEATYLSKMNFQVANSSDHPWLSGEVGTGRGLTFHHHLQIHRHLRRGSAISPKISTKMKWKICLFMRTLIECVVTRDLHRLRPGNLKRQKRKRRKRERVKRVKKNPQISKIRRPQIQTNELIITFQSTLGSTAKNSSINLTAM